MVGLLTELLKFVSIFGSFSGAILYIYNYIYNIISIYRYRYRYIHIYTHIHTCTWLWCGSCSLLERKRKRQYMSLNWVWLYCVCVCVCNWVWLVCVCLGCVGHGSLTVCTVGILAPGRDWDMIDSWKLSSCTHTHPQWSNIHLPWQRRFTHTHWSHPLQCTQTCTKNKNNN